ncbi:alpha/beta hydrolase family protein [Flavisolibacter tropicus]|uniref:Xaa-Pro dipeptidyl-peptidase-like domain-containing protein n=1 Tax=Flavisolibacter tropicus TaxID=1492898 RepID=A0A172TW95_9BACT|nr:alpha/beta fold hydrolase [Flavisolibacter tropicus]ANE51228.1 hypothetical protein SY85_12635 [Flavisolibacter tropicus]
MKNTLAILILFLVPVLAFSQDITGQWNGALSVQGMQLRLVFHITKTESGYSATMDSPDQGAKGIPVTTTTFENAKLKLEVAAARIEYSADLKDNAFVGTFKQGGVEFPLNLSRDAIEKATPKRPQEPTKPYPYYTEDVNFSNNNANVTLAGTLTLPNKEGSFPAVILITGSGPQSRDEELLGHKPFLILADYLTRNGIAVLRYDDRGVGQSTGDFKTATSADFATDVESAIAYLKTRKEINQKKIGLIGHSEGGIIAPMVASKSNDLDFIVLLAGTGIRGDQLLLMQQEAISKASGIPNANIQKNKATNVGAFQIILQSKDTQTLKADLTKYLEGTLQKDPTIKPASLTEAAFIDLQLNQLVSPWMTYFIKYDPAPALEKVKCAVLAVNGSKDLQVPAKENLAAIGQALKKGGNKKVTLLELPNLNHLFQESTTGLPAEYATIEQTISPTALEKITEWIKKQVQ